MASENGSSPELAGVEISLSLQVTGDQWRFLNDVAAILSEIDSGGTLPSIRVLQPVMASDPIEWEVRITHAHFAALGAYLDSFDRQTGVGGTTNSSGSGAASESGADKVAAALKQLLSLEGVATVDKGTLPVYRIWKSSKVQAGQSAG